MSKETEEVLSSGLLNEVFMTKRQAELFAEAGLGRDAIDFMNSDLGRLAIAYADTIIDDCKEQVLKTPTWRKRKIQKLQFDAAVAKMFKQFIINTVNNGRAAEETLIQERGQ